MARCSRLLWAVWLVGLIASCGKHRATPDEAERAEEAFYLTEAVDKATLLLRGDGSYTWNLDGGDYFGSGAGRWRRNGSTMVVLPEDANELSWPTHPSYGLSAITLERHGDELVAVVSTTSGGPPVRQTWIPQTFANSGDCRVAR